MAAQDVRLLATYGGHAVSRSRPGGTRRRRFTVVKFSTAYAPAEALTVPLPRVNDIVREKRSISPEMAVLRSAYFGTSEGYWINLQAHVDLEMAKDKVGKQAATLILTVQTGACSPSEVPKLIYRQSDRDVCWKSTEPSRTPGNELTDLQIGVH